MTYALLVGFYEVTYYLGYRDDYNIKMGEILKCVCEAERMADPLHADERINIIQESARTSTHMCVMRYVLSNGSRLNFTLSQHPSLSYYT
jgi:KUP system potassium uptake protein